MVLIGRLHQPSLRLAIFAAFFVAFLAGFGYTIYGKFCSPYTGRIRREFESWTPTFTTEALRIQFINPQGITSILLLIGGDLIAKAVAQLSCSFKHWPFTPVLFSYGWVSYVFGLLANAADGAGYFPVNDYSGLIMNLSSGDHRKINSWVIGRLFRDLEKEVDPDGRIADHKDDNVSLRVAVYQFDGTRMKSFADVRPKRDMLWWSFLIGLALQIGVAIIPMTPTKGRQEPNYYILLITLMGNLLSLLTGSFLANRSEKYGRFRRAAGGCRDIFALTKGNGYNIVIIILPNSFDRGESLGTINSKMPYLADMATASYRPSRASRIRVFVFGLLWIVLLLLIGGATADSWYLLLVGGIGMVHTIYVAGGKRSSAAHGIPLTSSKLLDTLQDGARQMDVLLELESKIPGAGYMLRREFFNGPVTTDDQARWGRFLNIGEPEKEHLDDIAKLQMDGERFGTRDQLAAAVDGFVTDPGGERRETVRAAAVEEMARMSDGRKLEFVLRLLQGLNTEQRAMTLIKVRQNIWKRSPSTYNIKPLSNPIAQSNQAS